MIVTQEDARKIIASHYGADTKIRLTTACQIMAVPVVQVVRGAVAIAWRKVSPGKNSAVVLGLLRPDLSIDWNADIAVRS